MKKKELKPQWEFPELENWTESNPKTLQFIFDMVQKRYEYTVELSNRIANRAFTLISILISILSLLFAWGIVPYLSSGSAPDENRILITTLISIPVIVCLGILIWIIFPKNFMHDGSDAARITKPEFIQHKDYTHDEQVIAILIAEIKGNQQKIDYNNSVNNPRIKELKRVIRILSISLFLLLVVAIVVSWS